MAGWAKNLEDSFGDLLSGDKDVTGATVFTKVYVIYFRPYDDLIKDKMYSFVILYRLTKTVSRGKFFTLMARKSWRK